AYSSGQNYRIQSASLFNGDYNWQNWNNKMFTDSMDNDASSVFDFTVGKYNGPAIAALRSSTSPNDDAYFLSLTMAHPSTGTWYDATPAINTYSGEYIINNVKLAYPNVFY